MISIVYVNYKTASLVIDSIKSVKENTTGVDYEIIVVDNASGDYSLDLIRKQYPEVICIQADDNLGFGKANNLALDQAKGDCILFLNPDTLLLNNALFELYSFLRSSDKIGACGGICMMRIISRQPRLAVNIRLSFGSYYLLCTYRQSLYLILDLYFSMFQINPYGLLLLLVQT